jgi:uncharacterized protein
MTRVMDAFNESFVAGDTDAARQCFTQNAIIWHNTDHLEQAVEDWVGGLKTLVGILPVRRIDVVQRDVFPGFCVQQQEIIGRNAWNRPVRIRTCILCRFSASGMIERLDEYLDSAALAQLTTRD